MRRLGGTRGCQDMSNRLYRAPFLQNKLNNSKSQRLIIPAIRNHYWLKSEAFDFCFRETLNCFSNMWSLAHSWRVYTNFEPRSRIDGFMDSERLCLFQRICLNNRADLNRTQCLAPQYQQRPSGDGSSSLASDIWQHPCIISDDFWISSSGHSYHRTISTFLIWNILDPPNLGSCAMGLLSIELFYFLNSEFQEFSFRSLLLHVMLFFYSRFSPWILFNFKILIKAFIVGGKDLEISLPFDCIRMVLKSTLERSLVCFVLRSILPQ